MNWKKGTVLSLLATGSISTTTLFISASNQSAGSGSTGLAKVPQLELGNISQDVADQFFARFQISKQNPIGVVQAYMVFSSFDPESQNALNERIYQQYGFNSFKDLLRTYIINFNMENTDPEAAQDLAAAVDEIDEEMPEVLTDPSLAQEYGEVVQDNFEELYNGAPINTFMDYQPEEANSAPTQNPDQPEQAPASDPNENNANINTNTDPAQTEQDPDQQAETDPNQTPEQDPANPQTDPNQNQPADPSADPNQNPETPFDLQAWIARFNEIISSENFQVGLVDLYVEYQGYTQEAKDQIDSYMVESYGSSFGDFVYQSLQDLYTNKAYIDNFDATWNQIITNSSQQKDLVQALWDIDQEAIYRNQLSPYYENLNPANPGQDNNTSNTVIDGQVNNQIDTNTTPAQNDSQIVQNENQQVTAPVTWPTAENGRENYEIQAPNNNNLATPAPSITNPTNTTSNVLSSFNIPSVGTFTTLAKRENRKIKLADGRETNLLPDYGNDTAWRQSKSPYNTPALWGQCTWFAWGRFYELYGFSPGFYGNGYECVRQLVSAHPELFEISDKPVAGSVFSSDSAHNHVGIVLEVDPITKKLTVQEGNLDIVSNPLWSEAIEDYRTIEISLSQLQSMYGDVTFANPKNIQLIQNYQSSYKEMTESKFIASQKALNQDLPLLAIDHYQDELEKFK